MAKPVHPETEKALTEVAAKVQKVIKEAVLNGMDFGKNSDIEVLSMIAFGPDLGGVFTAQVDPEKLNQLLSEWPKHWKENNVEVLKGEDMEYESTAAGSIKPKAAIKMPPVIKPKASVPMQTETPGSGLFTLSEAASVLGKHLEKHDMPPKTLGPNEDAAATDSVKTFVEVSGDGGSLLGVKAEQGQATVSVKSPDGSIEEIVEKIGKPQVFAGPTCEVGVESSFTMNLGNYQSARFGVSVKIPCAHTELDGVFLVAAEWVDAKMQALVDKAKKSKDEAF